jgi:hypothetical protein
MWSVGIATVQAAAGEAMDLGHASRNLSSGAKGEVVNEQEPRAERDQREKKAKKDTKTEERRNRDAVAATAVSLAHTQDIGTPRDAGTRSSVQKT